MRPGGHVHGSRSSDRRHRRALAVLALVLVLALLAPVAPGSASGAAAAAAQTGPLGPPPGAGMAHPRTLYAPGDEGALQDRLTREPYRTIFLTTHARADSWRTRPLEDQTKEGDRDRSRAAKALAFEYAIDRTVVGGEIVAFPSAEARQAQGDEVRDLLLHLFPHDRMGTPPPLGGWDRDISTSEEITSYSVALDLLLGGGYELGEHRAAIVERLVGSAGELHLHYVDPATANGYSDIHQNNHRSKSGMAMAVAAVVLADDVPDARAWFDDGVLLVEDTLRHTLVAGDGAYAEGPFYWRFTNQNLSPFLATWSRVLGDQPWTVGAVTMPSLADHPAFARTQQWMLDMTRPDGTLAPIDDGNPGRSFYFGALPKTQPSVAAQLWRWEHARPDLETDGNIDLGVESITSADESITPAEPWWSPTQTYVEGGTAVLREGWGPDDTYAVVLGEHDTAASFGRDRTGAGRAPQSHEHAEPGSFLLDAHGEQLVLDPGYLEFPNRTKVNKPQDHSVVLVDGRGPADYLGASISWLGDLTGRPPAEGMATLHGALDGEGLDAVSVATEYRDTEVQRRFLLADDAYVVIGDEVAGTGDELTWLLHGNGGGTSGGTFATTPTGGRWEIGGARLDGALALADGVPTVDSAESIHEGYGKAELTHTVLRGTATGGDALAVQVAYPSPIGQAPPTVTRVVQPGVAGLDVEDPAGDRRVQLRRDATGLRVIDEHADGSLRLAMADGATQLAHGGTTLVATETPGTLGVTLGPGKADVVAATPDAEVVVGDVGFTPAAVDGACGFTTDGSTTRVTTNRESRVTLRATPGDARPAADAGRDQRVAAGTLVQLDGRASCDAEGLALAHRWELVSSPAGSSWSLLGADAATPQLVADVPGPYRVRLVVTDPAGGVSLEDEVLVMAGDRCADGRDDDLDGLLDTDDPDCDALTHFLDVTAAHPFAVDVDWLLAQGITHGHADETFGPTDLLSRAGLSAWLYRGAGAPDGEDPTCEVAPFPDVPVDHLLCGEVAWAQREGLVGGYPDGTFRPGAVITRQSLAALVHRQLAPGGGEACEAEPFSDVPVDHPFCTDIAWAAEAGVVVGYTDGRFDPTRPVSRQVAAAMVHRAAGVAT